MSIPDVERSESKAGNGGGRCEYCHDVSGDYDGQSTMVNDSAGNSTSGVDDVAGDSSSVVADESGRAYRDANQKEITNSKHGNSTSPEWEQGDRRDNSESEQKSKLSNAVIVKLSIVFYLCFCSVGIIGNKIINRRK